VVSGYLDAQMWLRLQTEYD